MAYGNPNPGGDDTFADASPPKAAMPTEEKGEDYGATALLPKTVLGGKTFAPGEEVVLKIVKVHDDQVEVAYASEKGSGEGYEEEDPDKMLM